MEKCYQINYLAFRNQEIINKLKLIQHLPDYKRNQAEQWFLIIKEYEELKREAERLGKEFHKTKVIKNLGETYCFHHKTFYPYFRRYRKGGIEALEPGWGKRKGKSNIAKTILPVFQQIMEPGKGYKYNLEKLVPVCEQMGIKPPIYETFRNIVVANGLSEILTGKKPKPKQESTQLSVVEIEGKSDLPEWIRITDRKGLNLAIFKFDMVFRLLNLGLGGDEKDRLIDEIIKKKYHNSNEAVIRISGSSLYRYLELLKKYGFTWLFGNQHGSSAKKNKKLARVTFNIDLNDPLQCIKDLKSIIENNPGIAPEVKAVALRFFKHCRRYTRPGGYKYRRLSLDHPLTDDEIRKLERYRKGVNKNHRKRATAILMANKNCSLLDIIMEADCGWQTVYKWIRKFKENGVGFIETKKDRTKNNEELRKRGHRIIKIIHHSPKDYGINRTSWIYRDIAKVYKNKYDKNLDAASIRKVLKDANYTWRSARRVLTSPDPKYRQKTKKVLDTLRNLGSNDAFFFVDESGPWQVRKYGGKSWTKRGESKYYPQIQKPKGRVTFIGALDAVKNQVVWFFTKSKNTAAVVCLIKVLFFKYHKYSTINLTWDCASWHKSKGLKKCLENLNSQKEGPRINVVPLPKQSQFLNVIESVFSGVKSAVIFNSDYGSEYEMKMAIDQHFRERNEYFKANPKRAGNKIWDKEYYSLDHFESGLHKKM